MGKMLDDLLADIKTAMKSRETDKVTALRTLHANIKDAGTNAGKEETDELVATIVAKAIKQRKDSVAQFREGGRDDLADKEQAEIELFKKYQLEQMDEEALEALVRKAIDESGASGKQDMGKVMKLVVPQTKGRADGKLLSQLVTKLLG